MYGALVKGLIAIVVLVAACGGATSNPAATTTPTAAETSSASAADSGGPEFMALGFGTGGTGCNIEGNTRTFKVGVPIRTVLTWSPTLPTGSTITVTVEKDGAELDAPQTITVKEPTSCLWGTLPELEVGHYRVTYAFSSSQMPPATGELDVTP